MFTKSAAFYDAIYGWKDYAGEAQKLDALIRQHKRSTGVTLLDVACGTGAHAPFLRTTYEYKGLDLDDEMLAVAREQYPDLSFHHGDMANFDLGRQFDVVTCLFSSIGYARTATKLRQTLANLARHTQPGGVVIVEPWFTPEQWHSGRIHAFLVDEPELKICRMARSEIEGTMSILYFDYLVGTPTSADHFSERHEMGLFTHDAYLEAFRTAGLDASFDEEGLMGRGLYIGTKTNAH